jgi:coenzyme F420-reducing hydrogenase gamma subunit
MRPKVAVFDLTCCEGCELQILNCEEELPDLARMLNIVEFREAMTGRAEHYDITFIDGACSSRSEVAMLKEVRRRSKMVIPLGSCAHLGNVNCLKNRHPMEELTAAEFGPGAQVDTIPARPISAVIPIDYFIPGCPIVKGEFIRVVQELLAGRVPDQPNNPVCAECKAAENVCVFDLKRTCLGPVTRGGCAATCVTAGAVCWGCRGFIDDPNIDAEKLILRQAGLSSGDIAASFDLFNGCQEAVWK